jgi:hypothetical protein
MPKPPFVLVTLHTLLVLCFMLSFSRRWFAPPPFDCVYTPYFWLSGPLVHTVAHVVEHLLEGLFTPGQVMVAWSVVPGTVCLLLGGVQYWLLESWVVRAIRRSRQSNDSADTATAPE